MWLFLFFFNDTATTEIYTLSLHDALPIFLAGRHEPDAHLVVGARLEPARRVDPEVAPRMVLPVIERERRQRAIALPQLDRKSTRLNSSHANISYAVFCLKKKKKNINIVMY